MNQDKATARPWTANLSGQVFGDNEQRPILYNNSGNLTNAQMNANAALIVRCVNSHDKLVAALNELRSLALDGNFNNRKLVAELINQADEALNLAKGE